MNFVFYSPRSPHLSLAVQSEALVLLPRTRYQLRQTRAWEVHETVLHMGLLQPLPGSTQPTSLAFQTADLSPQKSERGPEIDVSEGEGTRWHQILEDGGVASVSRTQCDCCT